MTLRALQEDRLLRVKGVGYISRVLLQWGRGDPTSNACGRKSEGNVVGRVKGKCFYG